MFENFCALAKHNYHIPCALWTKRLDLIMAKLDLFPLIPENMTIIFSSGTLNRLEPHNEAIPHHTFTVFTESIPKPFFACPGKCASCMVCFKRKGPKHIGIIKHA